MIDGLLLVDRSLKFSGILRENSAPYHLTSRAKIVHHLYGAAEYVFIQHLPERKGVGGGILAHKDTELYLPFVRSISTRLRRVQRKLEEFPLLDLVRI